MTLLSLLSCSTTPGNAGDPPRHTSSPNHWVDSVYQTMNDTQRVAQLFMVAAYSNKDEAHEKEIQTLIKRYGIGGLIFMQGGPLRQLRLVNNYQQISKIPLLMAMDAEWGPAMRLDSCLKYPFQMTLGAMPDSRLVYEMGRQIARDLKALGIHMSFSPSVDVNNNPSNPVINFRSFGERPNQVADWGVAYMQGLQDEKVLACAKHFPGHGNTDADSHHTLPTLKQSRKALDSIELNPFRKIVAAGTASVMIAHLNVPALTEKEGLPTTLSTKAIQVLRKEMDFQGLVITDALNMKGAANFAKPGELEVQAFMAGNDILLFPEDVPRAIQQLLKHVFARKSAKRELEVKVKKILTAKFWCGLDTAKFPLLADSLIYQVNRPEAKRLVREIYSNAVTVVRDADGLIPWKPWGKFKKRLFIALGDENGGREMLKMLAGRIAADTLLLTWNATETQQNDLRRRLQDPSIQLVVTVHPGSQSAARGYNIKEKLLKNVIDVIPSGASLLIMGNAYTLKHFRRFSTVLVGYEDNPISREAVWDVLTGAVPASGKLPVKVTEHYPAGTGLNTCDASSFKFVDPLDIGLKSNVLAKIDSIVFDAIRKGAMPGCQILAAKGNEIFFQKSYGKISWNDTASAVNNRHVYDLASVTKIAASALALMRLETEGRLSLDSPVRTYLPETAESNKGGLILKQILTHQAGLVAWIPFWRNFFEEGKPLSGFFCEQEEEDYPYRIAENLFGWKGIPDSIWSSLLQSGLNEPGKYVYSDLGYYMVRRLVERLTGQPFDKYLDQQFYEPLGLCQTGFRPRNWAEASWLVPTEQDREFRFQVLNGDVHDQGAALMGGISGHAGLFGNAYELAVIMRMVSSGGEYAGNFYLNPAVIKRYITSPFPGNRRGICFDKAESDTRNPPVTAASSSVLTYGHTGFTGTCVWYDPTNELLYVFLSNRVHPNAENKKLSELKVRGRIQEVFNEALREIQL